MANDCNLGMLCCSLQMAPVRNMRRVVKGIESLIDKQEGWFNACMVACMDASYLQQHHTFKGSTKMRACIRSNGATLYF